MLMTAGYAFTSPSPSVSLCDQRILPRWQGSPVGNVSLDGKKLTTGAAAMQPAGNSSGWIGWIDCSDEHHPGSLLMVNGAPIGSRLILRTNSGSLLTIHSEKPAIEAWSFDDDGLHVVVKSRALHGEALIERFQLMNGSRASSCKAYGKHLPSWASPYAE